MTNRDLMLRRLYDYKTSYVICSVQHIIRYKKTIINKPQYINDLLDYLDI